MIKPGGQFFISTFEESPLDQAYEILDYGKWRKHNHRTAISCFYKRQNALDELKKIILQEGFVELYTKVEPDYFIPFCEKSYIGRSFQVNNIFLFFSIVAIFQFECKRMVLIIYLFIFSLLAHHILLI